MEKNIHNYSNSILQSSAAHGTNHDTQYEENPSSHHGGMCKDEWTDQVCSYILQHSARLTDRLTIHV